VVVVAQGQWEVMVVLIMELAELVALVFNG
jgi:hypothetical protein